METFVKSSGHLGSDLMNPYKERLDQRISNQISLDHSMSQLTACHRSQQMWRSQIRSTLSQNCDYFILIYFHFCAFSKKLPDFEEKQ